MRAIDLTGQRFGRLVVVERAPCNRFNEVDWVCGCACGNRKIASASHLKRGSVQSCGCLMKESATERARTHGKSNTPEHAIWRGMLSRCRNPNTISYNNYGGRGISVCDRWIAGEGVKTGFECFLEDMGPRPTSNYSIERRDVDGDYTPENCYWATPQEQVNNRRNTRYIIFKGKSLPLSEAVRRSGSCVHPETVWMRLKLGWPVESALNAPVKQKRIAEAAK